MVKAPERLVEVWAARKAGGQGKAGSGWVVGESGVLTAWHVVEVFDKAEGQLQSRPAGAGEEENWYDCSVKWSDPALDVALLEIVDKRWRAPGSSCELADPGDQPLACDVIGFPDSEARPKTSRDTEQADGRLLPAGGTRRGQVPFDVDTSTPESSELWQGISGAVIRDRNSRLVAVITNVHSLRKQRRLLATAIADIAADKDFRRAARMVGLDPALAAAQPIEPLEGLVDVTDHTRHDLPRVCDLDPYQLGTTASDYGSRDSYGEHDPYVLRTRGNVDTRLRGALQASRFVLVVGPSKVGKTRTSFEAVRATWCDARLAAPTPQTLTTLASHPRLRGGSDPLVVWLDDLDRFLATAEPISPAVLNLFFARPGPTVVVATLRREARDRLRAASGEFTRSTRYLLDNATTFELRSTAEDPGEQAAAHAAYPSQALAGTGLAERLGYAPELLMKYFDSRITNPTLHTVARAAIDWARTGMPGPIPEQDLHAIARDILWTEQPALDVAAETITTAIRDARKPLGHATDAAILLTKSLPGQSDNGGPTRGYYAHDYLVAADDGQNGDPRPLPDRAWQDALIRADSDDAFTIGMMAYVRGNRSASKRCLGKAAELGHANAMYLLGVALEDQAESSGRDAARRWYEKAAKADQVDAMFALGRLSADRGDPAGFAAAEHWYERAAKAGHADAMNNLGALLADRGDPSGLAAARHWYEQAIKAGHTGAMHNLGNFLAHNLDPPDLGTARHWYEQAANAGITEAMNNLGVMLESRWDPPELETARHWYEQATNAGNTMAMSNLGDLLESRWDPPELGTARHWYEQAVEAGDTDAMVNLGLLLESRWDPPELGTARHWYEQAANAGNTNAMNNLGVLLASQWDPPELKTARHWYERAANAGHTGAMVNLGKFLETRWSPREFDTAWQWWERAANAGNTDAMDILGLLKVTRWSPPELDAARQWWERAANAGNTVAMVHLGMLFATRWKPPKLDVALHWYEQAANAGNTTATLGIASVLTVTGDMVRARDLLQRTAQAGSTAAGEYAATLSDDPSNREGSRAPINKRAQAGDKSALNFLGVLQWRAGAVEDARAIWRHSCDAGDAMAPILLSASDYVTQYGPQPAWRKIHHSS
ncbi:bifunctional trypsin-like peptidase domain-containing/SEL1-like repeat protein [Streptomyces sp. NPDC004232]|uniref:bifunctional trypsin-like peptidase domain-containing/SEL1-like repeat protein n=1 Tax=Streptomyces sp. NPDC004232 TaxID=3154454 RepID=UPI0033B05628